MNNHPIGIFDSGVGGTSIWKEINALLPKENTIYLADSKNAPYGNKSEEQIVQYSIKNTELLLEKGCKLVVVACNTATTNAISHLRRNYGIPFIGIEPAIKPAALKSQSKTVGVLATKGTLTSNLFHSTSENHGNGIKIVEQVGTGLVPLIEGANVDSSETKVLLEKYMKPMLDEGMDHLVLGCTHYPYLIPVLKELLPEHVEIIDSGQAVARQTKAVLEQNGLRNSSHKIGKHHFYSNSDISTLKSFLGNVGIGMEISYLDF
ncbi:MAG: glutamate racemase [Maribacter sp.]|nr:glutamate racemase [Maribacter sp.]